MKKIALVVLWVFSLFFQWNCASMSPGKSANLNLISLEDWPQAYQKNFQAIRTMKSKTHFTVETPEFSATFTASFFYAAPDTLMVQAEGPFGMDLGKLFIGNHRFILYNQFNNQFFSGSLSDAYYNTFLQTSLTLKQVKYALLGYVPLPPNLKLIDKQNGIFRAEQENEVWLFVVDVGDGTLRSWEIQVGDQTRFRQEFKYYRFIENCIVPRLSRLVLPERQEMVSIYHKDIEINRSLDPEQYHIVIGPKVKQLMIQE
ncbi:MAG: hypothetical protein Kow0042_08860 [Calditrichia bacterium]